MKSLYFDESGFTGYDLLNADQPVFSIGSHDLSDDEAFELLKRSFPNYGGDEFKFTRIWSRKRSRKDLVNFSQNICEISERLFVYTCNKKFVVLTKIVDHLVEPVVHDAGQDFYAGGFNVKYANMAHYAFSNFVDDNFYSNLLNFYQAFARKPSPISLRTLQKQYRKMTVECPEYAKEFMQMMSIGAEMFERFSDIEKHRASSDIHLTTMVSSIAYWRSIFDEDFQVIHDESAHFFRQKDMWERITSTAAKDTVIYADDERKVKFPLRVANTVQKDSRGSPALQISDLISGLGAKIKSAYLEANDLSLINDVLDAGLNQINSGGLHPGTDFIDTPPEDLDGPDAIDQFNKIIFPKDVLD